MSDLIGSGLSCEPAITQLQMDAEKEAQTKTLSQVSMEAIIELWALLTAFRVGVRMLI
jgi:hypothetical protein